MIIFIWWWIKDKTSILTLITINLPVIIEIIYFIVSKFMSDVIPTLTTSPPLWRLTISKYFY